MLDGGNQGPGTWFETTGGMSKTALFASVDPEVKVTLSLSTSNKRAMLSSPDQAGSERQLPTGKERGGFSNFLGRLGRKPPTSAPGLVVELLSKYAICRQARRLPACGTGGMRRVCPTLRLFLRKLSRLAWKMRSIWEETVKLPTYRVQTISCLHDDDLT